ncbi:MAG: hypothetical protein QF450_05435 [Rhodospirillales bacterium]|nr:hypothetical protein [Rhodospirillales bacterium]HJO71402.1 hypothetical protein [Rhodospirillales bacterium]
MRRHLDTCRAAAPLSAVMAKDTIAVRCVATCVDEPEEGRQAYVDGLAEHGVPVWRALKDDGLLASRCLYEQVSVMKERKGVPAWPYLHLDVMAQGAEPGEFLRRQGADLTAAGADFGNAHVLCVEIAESMPLGYHEAAEGAESGAAVFTVEYIDVHEPFLDEYHLTMMRNVGPAFAAMVEAGDVLSFRALETKAVVFARDGLPGWNQIHLIGCRPDRVERLWPDLDAALQRGAPEGRGIKEFFGPLPEIRDILRMNVSRRVAALSLDP